MKEQITILMVHGWNGSKEQYKPIEEYIEQRLRSKNKACKFYEFLYSKNKGEVSIDFLSRKLAEFVFRNIKEQKFNIIGISQGGLIASNYVINYSREKIIEKCFTICTPHNGSFLAYFVNKKGVKDLRPSSKFLKKLNTTFKNYEINNTSKQKTNFLSVYTPFDFMVLPGWSANLKWSVKSKLVFALSHPLAIKSNQTSEFIANNL